MQKLSKEQCVVLTGFTGVMHGSFSDFNEDIEKRLGRPVFTHEMTDKETMTKIKEIYRNDFISMQPGN